MRQRPCSAGDYVLATKYSDGDPQDHWVIGFFGGLTAPHYDPPRFNVVDGEGNQFRGNGFRRVKKISAERGAWMLKHSRDIELSGRSVWHFARCRMSEPNSSRWRWFGVAIANTLVNQFLRGPQP